MNRLDNFEFSKLSDRHIQFVCLILIAVIEGFTLVFGTLFEANGKQFIVSIINILAVMYFCFSIRRPMSEAGKKLLLTGLAFVLWHIVLQGVDFLSHGEASVDGPRFIYNTFILECLVILPYACLSGEGEKLSGIKIFGLSFVLGSCVLCFLAALQCLNAIPDSLSGFFKWDDYRIETIWHVNILSSIFLISIAFILIFLSSSKKKLTRIFLFVLLLVEYYFFILTDSRADLIAFLFMIISLVMCLTYQKTKDSTPTKKWIITISAGLIAAVFFFVTHHVIIDFHIAHLPNFETGVSDSLSIGLGSQTQAEKYYNYRKSASSWLRLGGRAAAWIYIIQQIIHNPKIWLFGIKHVGAFMSEGGISLLHAHNAWLQIFLKMGLVGFLFALYFTFITVKNSFILIFRRNSSIVQKAVCILSLAIMISQLMEIYIFSVDYPVNYINIVYFLCVGYEVHWVSQSSRDKTGKN